MTSGGRDAFFYVTSIFILLVFIYSYEIANIVVRWLCFSSTTRMLVRLAAVRRLLLLNIVHLLLRLRVLHLLHIFWLPHLGFREHFLPLRRRGACFSWLSFLFPWAGSLFVDALLVVDLKGCLQIAHAMADMEGAGTCVAGMSLNMNVFRRDKHDPPTVDERRNQPR